MSDQYDQPPARLAKWDSPALLVRHSGAAGMLAAIGAVLFVAFAAIRFVSPAFFYGSQPPLVIIIFFISLMMISGLCFLFLFFVIARIKLNSRVLFISITAGVVFRLLFFGSTPVYEDDWHRYLWDGAAVSAGVNPYIYAPADAVMVDGFGTAVPLSDDAGLRRLQELGRDHPVVLDRINYPFISTIYPPLAQLGFAAAHQIKPFSLDAWRGVLLAADVATIFVLLAALKAAGRNRLWALLYWWNPVAIVAAFNAGHMDVLMAPFLLGALLLVQKQRPLSAAVCLAAAAGVKFWPLVLAPVLFRQWRKSPHILVATGGILLAATALFLAPMILSLEWDRSGLNAYAQSWRRNAFIFPLIAGGLDFLTADGDLWARAFVALAVGGASIWLGLRGANDNERLGPSLLFVAGLLFFLSPTGYPWYVIWLLLFMPFSPSLGIGALTVTIPFYYMRYYLEAHGRSEFFDIVIVPIEFLIPLGVLLLERARRFA